MTDEIRGSRVRDDRRSSVPRQNAAARSAGGPAKRGAQAGPSEQGDGPSAGAACPGKTQRRGRPEAPQSGRAGWAERAGRWTERRSSVPRQNAAERSAGGPAKRGARRLGRASRVMDRAPEQRAPAKRSGEVRPGAPQRGGAQAGPSEQGDGPSAGAACPGKTQRRGRPGAPQSGGRAGWAERAG